MNTFDRLHFLIDGELEAWGGPLDKLDYGRLRRLGVQLRNIPLISEEDWEKADYDHAPATYQGWISSYYATVEAIRIAQENGLLSILKDNSEEIRQLLSPSMIPALDTSLIEEKIPKRSDGMNALIEYAKKQDRFKDFDYEHFSARAPSKEEIVDVVVVQLNVSVRWSERPKVTKDVGLKRLQIAALIGKASIGGALAVGNLSLGALGGLTSLHSIAGTSIPLAVGIVGSTYTGFASAFDAIEKIASIIRG